MYAGNEQWRMGCHIKVRLTPHTQFYERSTSDEFEQEKFGIVDIVDIEYYGFFYRLFRIDLVLYTEWYIVRTVCITIFCFYDCVTNIDLNSVFML